MPWIHPGPCKFCPYRRDVPSGVWAEFEYRKLIDYDKPTGEQPIAAFHCHERPTAYCTGWAQCHSNRGHDRELLAIRIDDRVRANPQRIPPVTIPLFASGAEAAAHGLAQTKRPGLKAILAVKYLGKRIAARRGQ